MDNALEQVKSDNPFTDDEIENIRIIKLGTGEDIIGSLKGYSDKMLVVKRPSKIVTVQQDNGRVAVVIIKWQPFSNDPQHGINIPHVVSFSNLKTTLVDFYVRTVKSQIEEENMKESEFVEPNEEDIWPEWMKKELSKTQIN